MRSVLRRAGLCRLGAALVFATIASAVARADTGNILVDTSGASPSIELDELAGGRFALERAGPKVRLIHFFATWCAPCQAEIPSLERLQQRWREQGVEVVAINVGEPDIRVARFFEKSPVTFAILLDRDRQVTKRWSVDVLPTSFVLRHDSRQVLKVDGDLDWDKAEFDARLDTLLRSAATLPPSPTQADRKP